MEAVPRCCQRTGHGGKVCACSAQARWFSELRSCVVAPEGAEFPAAEAQRPPHAEPAASSPLLPKWEGPCDGLGEKAPGDPGQGRSFQARQPRRPGFPTGPSWLWGPCLRTWPPSPRSSPRLIRVWYSYGMILT